MKSIVAIAIAAGMALAGLSPAAAAGGCGPGLHRGPAGGCRPNIVRRGPGRPMVGRFYHGRGYWDGYNYRPHRYRHDGGWRYR